MKIALYLCVLISATVIGHSEDWKRSRDLPVTAVYSIVEHRGAMLAILERVRHGECDGETYEYAAPRVRAPYNLAQTRATFETI